MEAILTYHSRTEVKKRKPKKNSHLTKPKKNRTGYTFYFINQFPKIKAYKFGSQKEILMHIGYQWRNLSCFRKSIYEKKAAKDKERYLKEMKIYNDKQKSVPEEKKEQKGNKNIRVLSTSKRTFQSIPGSINKM
ncbi:hypothetical protein ZOSMA_20G01300 [Zostera marina]|uniref:HMG box domain-containing protein n=1 Tax=Zostera marina TaxID=29655 RepID=A0A0K9PN69_ZOSMR|nr:hypothetical protein ZOSMA_20G01300 [Zostera marina]